MDGITRVEPTKKRGGEWIVIGEESYRVAPLAFGDLKEIGPQIDSLKVLVGMPSPEQMDLIIQIITMALHRNYPDLPSEEVRAMVDLGNYQQLFMAVMGISGFKKVAPGESSGEAKASIGTESTSG